MGPGHPGGREELDELFFDEVDRETLKNMFQPYSPEERIKRTAIDESGVRAPEGVGTADEWNKMVKCLCDTFADHVREWPYEASTAQYLPADR